jgi:acyl carrier protein
MPEPIAARVRALIIDSLPPSASPDAITDEARLDEGALGLDSVGLVDLLCACEEEFDIDLPGDVLVTAESPLTVARLVAEVTRRVGDPITPA